jgi:hypothetical protein
VRHRACATHASRCSPARGANSVIGTS